MKKHPSIRLARRAFEELSHVFYSEMVNHADQLLSMCKAEEKGHRGILPRFTECHTADTASVSDCAHLFAVKRVADYLLGCKYPSGQDFIHTQKSCFLAAAIADEFGDKVRSAWTKFELRELVALNYTDVVKVRKPDAQPIEA